MPTKKIKDVDPKYLDKVCYDPGHNVPSMQVFEPGTYEHTCPSCGNKIVFTVSRPFWLGTTRVKPIGRAAVFQTVAKALRVRFSLSAQVKRRLCQQKKRRSERHFVMPFLLVMAGDARSVQLQSLITCAS